MRSARVKSTASSSDVSGPGKRSMAKGSIREVGDKDADVREPRRGVRLTRVREVGDKDSQVKEA